MMASVQEELAAPLDRLGCAGRPSLDEAEALARTIVAIRDCPPRAMLAQAGRDLRESILLLEGIVLRQAELPDGRRQILALHLPGDFVDLHGLLLKRLDHDVIAASAVRIALASHDALRRITEEQPHLARKLWFVTTVDAAIHRRWIALLARPAVERVAHLLCELQARFAIVGRADASGYALPLTQADLADATALTPVHVNRTLRQLRERGLVNFRNGRVMLSDLDGLRRIARFDDAYLYLHRGDL